MQHGRVNIAQGDTGFIIDNQLDGTEKEGLEYTPSETSNECNELIQILCTKRTDQRAEHDHREPKGVLRPFDLIVTLSTLCEQPILDDTNSREELKRYR